MIGVNKESLTYQQKLTYPMIRYIRLCRNLTQERFGEVCRIDQSVLAKLERGEIELTVNYEGRILHGCQSLKISEMELDSITKLLELNKEITRRGQET
ncbi:helix-turn-helix domain-containing protein [Peribacillus frigoritolerans]|uniref:helix-turn-helix domain-containing protein n=1 Tax=Peribacillus frigoritolerans TaxID=450367 RepID=UPI001F4FCD22|nr:helix-turn-helix transcriptional regulator [Peribacillus frigoritolerans]MCK2018844.1 helix-turn-helix domain-containing protein [Peribacillus frigoritolerans]